MRAADAHTIENEPISSVDLMERAATAMFDWMMPAFRKPRHFKIFCGIGNNGGDGLVLARLFQESWHTVEVFAVRFSEDSSADFKANEQRLKEAGIELIDITSKSEIPNISKEDTVLDALFGTGLTRPVKGLAGDVIEAINSSQAEVVAVDIPSGLFAEPSRDQKGGKVVVADLTLTFEAPKLSFVLPDTGRFVGQWHVIPIGLDKKFMAELKTEQFVLSDAVIKQAVKFRAKFSHKGTFGHSLIVGGSHGKIGAAILASKAVLRSGAGLLTVQVPNCGYVSMQTALPEAMCVVDKDEHKITEIKNIGNYRAIGIGPGLGTDTATATALKLLIQNTPVPLVIDADGLNILAENKTWLAFLPPGSILTPHPAELSRLIGSAQGDQDKLNKMLSFCVKHRLYVLMKGAHTAIACPDGRVFFNNTGNPGMGTAGSGDVLTGVITALMSQGYSSLHAALTGVYLHGLAGDIAAEERGMSGMIASDIVEALPKAFQHFGT